VIAKHDDLSGIVVDAATLIGLRKTAKEMSLNTRLKSRSSIDGSSRSALRGRGMEFSEVRHYQPGDDIRNIDWRVTARTQETYTKLFQEEKERPVYLLVDQRQPMFFGSKLQFKSVLAAKAAAAIAWTAFANRDRLGAIIWSANYSESRAPAALSLSLAIFTISMTIRRKHCLCSQGTMTYRYFTFSTLLNLNFLILVRFRSALA